MVAELRGSVPGYSSLLAKTHIRESWTDIRNMKGWSFQLGNGGFSTPGVMNAGSCTTTFGSPTVTPDATAQTAWLAASQFGSLITQRQFRVGQSAIYNIIAIANATGVITLDRPWVDLTTGAGLGYAIYQCYYAVPAKDFQAWESVLDVTNVIDLTTGVQRPIVDRNDPQRQVFSNPTTILSYQVDSRPGSSTLGWMMYELYPQPQAQYAYQTWYSRGGADLVLPTDTLPYPITEDWVKCLARIKAYEWAEANKDPANPRGTGSDYRFLVGLVAKEADGKRKEIRSLDRDRVDMWNATMSRLSGQGPAATFNPATGYVQSRNL